MGSIELLLSLLDVIENTDVIESIEINYEHPYIKSVQYCANEVIITDMGKVNSDIIDILSINGYIVSPGETDGFGWVTGIIQTTKGDIVFG